MAQVKKVLMVDDSPTVKMIMGSALEAKGYQMIYFGTTKDGLQSVKSEKPDLILLDLMLPDGSGFDMLKQLKEDDETKKIPVIILTGKDGGEEVVKGRQLGADDYCVKMRTTPIVLYEKVKKLIGE